MSSTMVALFAILVGTFAAGITMGTTERASATHFRSASLGWHRVGTTTPPVVEFHLVQSWRRDFSLAFHSAGVGNLPVVGSIIRPNDDGRIDFGDATSLRNVLDLFWRVVAVDVANNSLTAEAVNGSTGSDASSHLRHTYASATNLYAATYSSCCRLEGGHMNNPGGKTRLSTTFRLSDASASAESSLPPIVDCPRNAVCSFTIPAVDNSGLTGTALRWRLATAAEASGTTAGFEQPAVPLHTTTGLPTVNPGTGQFTWNTTNASLATAPNDTYYSAQVVISVVRSNGVAVSSIPVDFFIRILSRTDAPPVFKTPPTPAAPSSVITAPVGSEVTFTAEATDPDAGDRVTLGLVGAPAGSAFTPATVASGARSVFTWTPTVPGYRTMNLTAADQFGLGATPRAVTIVTPRLVPQLSWTPATPFPYGTELGAAHQNATAAHDGAPVPGTFRYYPEPGTVLPAGTRQISAYFTPTDVQRYQPVSKAVLVTVTRATPEISWEPAALTYPNPVGAAQLNAVASFQGQPVAGSFTFDPPVGTVLGAGVRTITATFTPTSPNFTTATAPAFVTVVRGPVPLLWPTPAGIDSATPLGAAQLNASAPFFGTFSYSPPAGTTLPVGTHTLTATFTPEGPSAVNYRVTTITTRINVGRAAPALTWATPASIPYGTPLGDAQLSAVAMVNGSPVPGTFEYSPAAGEVLSVGTHELRVLFTPDDPNLGQVEEAVTIEVTPAVPSIEWDTPAPIVYGAALDRSQLDAVATFQGELVAGSYAYSPGGRSVLTAGRHELQVVFTPKDTTRFAPARATVSIVVEKATPRLTWADPSPIVFGSPLSADQLAAFADAPGTFEYSPDFGTVLDAGDDQTLSVSFTPADVDNYEPAFAVASIDVLRAVPAVSWDRPEAITFGSPITEDQLDAIAALKGELTYDPPVGTVLPAGTHVLSASFVPADAHNFQPVTTTVEIEVLRATPVLTWSRPADVVFGTPLSTDQLNATAAVPGAFVYDPPIGTVLDAGIDQLLTVRFVPDDGANFDSSTEVAFVSVRQAPQVIDFDEVAPKTFGDAPFHVAATGGGSAQPVTFTAGAGDRCVVDGSEVTLTGAGVCTITAHQAGDRNHLDAVPVTRSVTVAKQTPVIEWSAPAPITYGTALSPTQLDAGIMPSSLAGHGAFTYLVDGVPALGAHPSAGTHVLTATFEPTGDAADDFTVATSSVELVVERAPQAITLSGVHDLVFGDAPMTVTADVDSGLAVTLTGSGPCSVAGAVVTATGAGTCTLTATQAGNADHLPAAPVQRTFTIAKRSQSLTMAPIGEQPAGGQVVVVVAGGGSAAPVVLDATPSTVCTVSGTTLSLVRPGSCTVRATQAGDVDHLDAAPVSEVVLVSQRVCLNFDTAKPKRAGSALAVKVFLCDAAGTNTSSAADELTAVDVDGRLPAPAPGSDSSGLFRFTGGNHHYNLDTSGLSAGRHVLRYRITGDPTVHGVAFEIAGP